VRFGAGFCREFSKGPSEFHRFGEERDPSIEENARDRRLLRIDGAPQRGLTGLAERLAVLWLTPQMDGLFLESKSARRRFLDRLVASFDPSHASRLNAYEQAAGERLRLLRGEMAPGRADPGWLSALEQQIDEMTPPVGSGQALLDCRQNLNYPIWMRHLGRD
jgi:DNA replication and repair protein RecF